MQTIYFDPAGDPEHQKRFRRGEAWLVSPDPDAIMGEPERVLPISVIAYNALFHLGVIDALQELPGTGLLGAYEEGMIPPRALTQAASLIEDAASRLSGTRSDVLASTELSPHNVQHRVRLDPGVVIRDFRDLAEYFRLAEREGLAVQLWL